MGVRYVTLHFRDWRGAASLRPENRAEITVLLCEQKPRAVRFACRRKSCMVFFKHSLRFELTWF